MNSIYYFFILVQYYDFLIVLDIKSKWLYSTQTPTSFVSFLTSNAVIVFLEILSELMSGQNTRHIALLTGNDE